MMKTMVVFLWSLVVISAYSHDPSYDPYYGSYQWDAMGPLYALHQAVDQEYDKYFTEPDYSYYQEWTDFLWKEKEKVYNYWLEESGFSQMIDSLPPGVLDNNSVIMEQANIVKAELRRIVLNAEHRFVNALVNPKKNITDFSFTDYNSLHHNRQTELIAALEEWSDEEYNLLSAWQKWQSDVDALYTEEVENWNTRIEEFEADKDSFIAFLEDTIDIGEIWWENYFDEFNKQEAEAFTDIDKKYQKDMERFYEIYYKTENEIAETDQLILFAEKKLLEGQDKEYWESIRDDAVLMREELIQNSRDLRDEIFAVNPLLPLDQEIFYAERVLELKEQALSDYKELDSIFLSLSQDVTPETLLIKLEQAATDKSPAFILMGRTLLAAVLYGEHSLIQDKLCRLQEEVDFWQERKNILIEVREDLKERSDLIQPWPEPEDIGEQIELFNNLYETILAGVVKREEHIQTLSAEKDLLFTSLQDALHTLFGLTDSNPKPDDMQKYVIEDTRTWQDLPHAPVNLSDNADLLFANASLWLRELNALGQEHSVISILHRFNLAAFYCLETQPDLILSETNTAFRELEKIADLDIINSMYQQGTEQYQWILNNQRLTKMFYFYLSILQSEKDISVWEEGVLKDLDDKSVEIALSEAGERQDYLNAHAAIHAGMAAFYTGMAAAVAFPNFWASAIFLVNAATHAGLSLSTASDAKDIEILRNQLQQIEISGDREREEIKQYADAYVAEFIQWREKTQNLTQVVEIDITSGACFNSALMSYIDLSIQEENSLAAMYENIDFSAENDFLNIAETTLELLNEQNQLLKQEQFSYFSDMAAAWQIRRHDFQQKMEAQSFSHIELQEKVELYVTTVSPYNFDRSLLADDVDFKGAAHLLGVFTADTISNHKRGYNMMRYKLGSSRFNWENAVSSVYTDSLAWWDRQRSELNSSAVEWLTAFQQEYEEGRDLWFARIDSFKNAQMQEMEKLTANELYELNKEAEQSLSLKPGTLKELLTMIDVPSAVVVDNIPKTDFFTMERYLDIENAIDSITTIGNLVYSPPSYTGIENWNLYKSVLQEVEQNLTSTIETATVKAHTQLVKDYLLESMNNLRQDVFQANRRVERNLHDQFLRAGYKHTGSQYLREVPVDILLLRAVTEQQSIEGYYYFELPEYQWNNMLQFSFLAGEENITSAYHDLLGVIAAERSLVFGDYSDMPDDLLLQVNNELREHFILEHTRFVSSDGFDNQQSGLFGYHLGYVPTMDEHDPSKVICEGYGELGRIFSDYYIQEWRNQRAIQMLDDPFYDRRFWDDDPANDGSRDGLIKALTIRDTVNIGSGIASSILLPPGLSRIAASMAGQFMFSAADVAAGRLDFDEALFNIGKQGLMSTVSTGINQLGSSVHGIEGLSFWQQSGAELGITALQGISQESIGALTYHNGSFGYNGFGDSFLFDVSLDLSRTAASQLYNSYFLDSKRVQGYSTYNRDNINELGNFLIDAGFHGLRYAEHGEIDFNILNTNDFLAVLGSESNNRNSGVFEVTLGRKGVQASFGGRGMDISASRWGNVRQGLDVVFNSNQINSFVRQYGSSSEEIETALRFLYSYGDEAAQELLDNFYKDQDSLNLHAFNQDDTTRAITMRDEGFDHGRRIYLDYNESSAGINAAVRMAMILQHEAYRDGTMAYNIAEQTEQAVAARIQMAVAMALDPLYGDLPFTADPILVQDFLALSQGDFSAYVSHFYDSSADYFRLEKDGYLYFDGSAHFYGDGAGLLRTAATNDPAASLADLLGVSYDLAAAMLEHNDKIKAPYELMAEYFLQKEIGMHLVSTFGGSVERAQARALQRAEVLELYDSDWNTAFVPTLRNMITDSATFGRIVTARNNPYFPGILQTATTHYYSQQQLEYHISQGPLEQDKEASESVSGYCFAHALMLSYQQAFGVDFHRMVDTLDYIAQTEALDRESGFVGSKRAFSQYADEVLQLGGTFKERRFETLAELQNELQNHILETSDPDIPVAGDYFVVAQYDTHFTYVSAEGLEINTYENWNKGDREPIGWRIYFWDRS